MYLSASQANASHRCLICGCSAQMSSNIYVVHNARKDVGIDSDIWLVIDTISGTAIASSRCSN
jgi:hypothetical protein